MFLALWYINGKGQYLAPPHSFPALGVKFTPQHNKALQRTKKEVTFFAKQKNAPSFFAAELERYTLGNIF